MRPSPPQSALRCPLNTILGSQANVRILREAFRHGGALSVTRLAMSTGLSAYGVRLALATLLETGVVEELGSGRTHLYRVICQHPLAAVLDNLFRAEEERTDAVIAAVREAVADELIRATWIYGSFARGEDRHGSDLDIAVVATALDDGLIDRVRDHLHAAAERLHFAPSVVGLALADVVRLSGGDPWWTNVVREAIAVKGPRPEALADTLLRATPAG